MTTPIRTNKPVFFGDNGDVLKNGYIYIGQPDSDPIANPKTVTFRDSAGGEFTAAQPLRTNTQGRIEYNGLAIIALVDGNYSMLVQDRNQVTVKDGYTKLVEADDESSGDNIITYRTTLSDLKAVNVTPGQYVENIGKATAEDGEGVRWLVVSNTGGTADDVDLIDFDNGTQGKRISNQLYVIKNLSEISDAGASAKSEARINIGVDYQTATVDITTEGAWDTGSELFLDRSGRRVMITSKGILSHALGAGPTTGAGAIPVDFRPTSDSVANVYYGADAATDFIGTCIVHSDGAFEVRYKKTSDGTNIDRTDTGRVVSISYGITP